MNRGQFGEKDREEGEGKREKAPGQAGRCRGDGNEGSRAEFNANTGEKKACFSSKSREMSVFYVGNEVKTPPESMR